ncbi:hypothetical protein DYB26_009315 [Aphanomyces astaci]|uniref:Uncharacterized protein n=1 Tax=Aphanomyces astaci TaxID=112090 RepID=A0A397ENG6_APHAT|nr:hypothetical protein DYB26_009315 [Aphanomyces astaci]RHZ01154.1 hypothetical protein DYB31_016240 [Aphanomyces astaci]
MPLIVGWTSLLLTLLHVSIPTAANGGGGASNSCNLTNFCGIACFEPKIEGCCNGTIFSLVVRQFPIPRLRRQSCCLAVDGTAYVSSFCPMLYRPLMNATSPPVQVIIAPPFVIAISTNVSGRAGNNLTAPYGTSNTTVLPPLMSQATTASPTATTPTPTTVSPPATPVTAAPEATTAETTTVAPSPIRLATATKTPTPTPTLNNGSTEAGHLFAFAWCVGMVVATASVA